MIAAAPGGRIFGATTGDPWQVVELFPDNTQRPLTAPIGGRFVEDLIVAGSGAFYVRARPDSGSSRTLYAFRPDGTLRATYALSTWIVRADMDLAADQCTLYYGSSAGDLARFDVCTGSPLTPLVLRRAGYDHRVLPDGTILTGGTRGQLRRYAADGTLMRTYTLGSTFEDVWSIGLADHGATAYVSTGLYDGELHRLDLFTGEAQRLGPSVIAAASAVVPRLGWTAAIGASSHGSDVPTLSEWAMLIALAGLAWLGIRRV